ncbi:hypothetical protein ACFQ0D_32665, partial [Micromonospora zhanjiangensis]
TGTAAPSGAAGTAATSAVADPRQELAAAATKLGSDTVKVKMSMAGGLNGSGAMDPAAKKAQMAMNVSAGAQSIKMDIVMLDKDLYLKITGMPNMSNKWMHVDASKVKAGSSLDVMPGGDPAGASKMINSVVDVQRDGEHRFKGTLDLTKAQSANAAALSALGDKAKAVPFTATVDGQGRLTDLTVQMSTLQPGVGDLKTSYSDFGAPVSVNKPPAGQTTEAPSELLNLFNA